MVHVCCVASGASALELLLGLSALEALDGAGTSGVSKLRLRGPRWALNHRLLTDKLRTNQLAKGISHLFKSLEYRDRTVNCLVCCIFIRHI